MIPILADFDPAARFGANCVSSRASPANGLARPEENSSKASSMPITEYFSSDYSHARAKFRQAAENAGAVLHDTLSIDVAIVGPQDASRCFLLISGTHGVEGFAGSGCQVGFFRDSLHAAFGHNVRVIVLHGLNPYGFGWLRRVNEDNVDLNRNFQDFTQPLLPNEAYTAVHGLLIPSDWDGAGRRAADAQLQEFIRVKGFAALQTAVSGGQYTHADGLFLAVSVKPGRPRRSNGSSTRTFRRWPPVWWQSIFTPDWVRSRTASRSSWAAASTRANSPGSALDSKSRA
jgi:hypothetical protein